MTRVWMLHSARLLALTTVLLLVAGCGGGGEGGGNTGGGSTSGGSTSGGGTSGGGTSGGGTSGGGTSGGGTSGGSTRIKDTWTWMSGSSTVSAGGSYGTKGTGAIGNVPGARKRAVSWTDATGKFWIFGGHGPDGGGSWGDLNDLWNYSPSTGLWTWVSGSYTHSAMGSYGTLRVAASGNVPSARQQAVSWIDSSGKLWLFGGYGNDSAGNWGRLNDLWMYTPADGMWTWQGGSSTSGASGTYGSQGIADSSNVPTARNGAVSWTDSSGNLWLFGGSGTGSGQGVVWALGELNDLWMYSPATGLWKWVSGSNTTGAKGNYGTQGTAASGNMPGARQQSVGWTDASGNLWLFGGSGYDSSGSWGDLNDLWMYSPTSGLWTWVSGSSTCGALGTYGTQGSPASSNVPGARRLATGWADASGNLLLFGGFGPDPSGSWGDYNDLWMYSPASGLWTWVSGSSTSGAYGTWGTRGTPAIGNMPSARSGAVTWIDPSGTLWLFGGSDDNSGLSWYNDLWRYTP
jgi:N-acetylneuraminic acid mutarotase